MPPIKRLYFSSTQLYLTKEPNVFILGSAAFLILVYFLFIRQIGYFFLSGAVLSSLFLIEKNRNYFAVLCILGGITGAVFYRSASEFLKHLGVDSFTETLLFDWNEALFFLSTLRAAITPQFSVELILLSSLLGLLGFIAINKLCLTSAFKKHYSAVIATVTIGFIGIPSGLLVKNSLLPIIESLQIHEEVKRNFTAVPPVIHFGRGGLKLVVYIGESTSSMHMGLYGYFRETTPHLSYLHRHDDNFLRFNNVFSTHTHTSPSLLEALSLGLRTDQNFLPIHSRQRVSIIDILNRNNIENYLFSNQGESGTHNLASSVIFKNSVKKFSTQSRFIGNLDHLLDKPFDDQFFHKVLRPVIHVNDTANSRVVFLHSYAGHGSYLEYISDAYKRPVDQALISTDPALIAGQHVSAVSMVEEYDSAIRYVDYAVTRSIEEVKASTEPAIFVYFADHGDSAYSGRGHDSSRFVYEMLRVPFIMYFNEAAKSQYPELFEKYRRHAEQENTATLAQLPATLLDLLGGYSDSPTWDFSKVVGGDIQDEIPPILVRKQDKAVTYLNLNRSALAPPVSAHMSFVDVTDEQTTLFVHAKYYADQPTRLCYQQATSLGKAARGAHMTTCLEHDLKNMGQILRLARKNKLALWLNDGQLALHNNCAVAASTLRTLGPADRNVLVELSPNDFASEVELARCSASLRQSGARTAFSVPTNILLACTKHLPNPVLAEPSCQAVQEELMKAANSQLYTDYAFDIAGLAAMEVLPAASSLNWNAKNVLPQHIGEIEAGRFSLVSISSDDPNNQQDL